MKRKDTTTRTDDAEKKQKNKEIAHERRRQSALERLGTNNPRCSCGEDDWRVLEKHHIAGKTYDDFTCIQCRNCHRKLSDQQKDHPEQIGTPIELPEIIGRFLLGLADFFESLIEKLREFGNALIESVQGGPVRGEVRT